MNIPQSVRDFHGDDAASKQRPTESAVNPVIQFTVHQFTVSDVRKLSNFILAR